MEDEAAEAIQELINNKAYNHFVRPGWGPDGTFGTPVITIIISKTIRIRISAYFTKRGSKVFMWVGSVRTKGRKNSYTTVGKIEITNRESVASLIQSAKDAGECTQESIFGEPYTFLPNSQMVNEHNSVVCQNQIMQARVMGLASVRNLCIIDMDSDFARPGIDAWFILDCRGHSGATFNIITDGERFYYTVDKFITELLALEPPRESINHVKLLCPHDFNKPSIQSVGDTINLVHFYQNVRVIGFGRILEDLRVSTEVESPDSDCWFILEGHTIWNGADATARMLVKQDGDKLVFVPVMTFTTKMHICDMTTKGKRIDYNGCTVIDGEIVREAITHYLSKM